MAQLSRPFQVAFILLAALAVAWFALLRTHVLAGAGSTSASSSHASSAAAGSLRAPTAGSISNNDRTPTKVYHGAAPGLQGLSRDVHRAQEAVGASEAQTHKVAGESGGRQTSSHLAISPRRTSNASAVAHHEGGSHAVTRSPTKTGSAKSSHSSAGARDASRAVVVGNQLKAGRVVLLLFWSASSSEDQAVRSQLQAASRSLAGKVAADYAKPSEVSAFGAITRDVTVLQTPTLLIIDGKGLVRTIAGLTDAFSIEQAVREAGG